MLCYKLFYEKKSSCHCDSVQLIFTMLNDLQKLRRCNCSICSRKNAVVASVKIANLEVVKGKEFLSKYTFNTYTAKHYFCSKCGIYTHHQRRLDPSEYGINIACIEGILIEDYLHIGYDDGKNNHPLDNSANS